MHHPPSGSHRIHGLDTLRALAIVLVFMYHYMVFVSSNDTFGFVSRIGWVGVDLFFALSGYLIGNQILAALRDGRGFYGWWRHHCCCRATAGCRPMRAAVPLRRPSPRLCRRSNRWLIQHHTMESTS